MAAKQRRGQAPALVVELERALEQAGDPKSAVSDKAYLKSALVHFGVPVPVSRPLIRAIEKASPIASSAELFAIVDALWAREIWELRSAAVELLVRRGDLLSPRQLPALRQLVGNSHTWALVDPLSTDVVGAILAASPEIADVLDTWAEDADFWVRRAAMLAHLRGLRAGGGDFARFARYADAMLDEREFFIRKAIGWILRETSKQRPALVADWLAPRMHRASGVTTREALKYLSAAQQKRLRARATSARRGSARSASG